MWVTTQRRRDLASHLVQVWQLLRINCYRFLQINASCTWINFVDPNCSLCFIQLMAVSVCGLLGQLALRRVGLVLNLEAEPVITQLLLMADTTALMTPLRPRAVNSRHALVSNIKS